MSAAPIRDIDGPLRAAMAMAARQARPDHLARLLIELQIGNQRSPVYNRPTDDTWYEALPFIVHVAAFELAGRAPPPGGVSAVSDEISEAAAERVAAQRRLEEAIVRAHEQGRPVALIARLAGMSRQAIYNVLERS
jgi:hypothetical protein